MYYDELLRNCYAVAVKESDDLSCQNAACLVLSSGTITNPVPNKIPDKVEKLEERIKTRPTKYDFIEHAERGAIYKAAKRGLNLSGAIVLSGIKKVVTHKRRNELTSLGRHKVEDVVSDRWITPITNGDIILKEAGIEVVQYDFHAGMLVLVNEQLVEL